MVKWTLGDYFDYAVNTFLGGGTQGPFTAGTPTWQNKTLIGKFESSASADARLNIPEIVTVTKPNENPVLPPVVGKWTRIDRGEYWEISDPDGNIYKVWKELDIGQRIENALDDHLTWGNIFKLGLLGLGATIFLGGVKMQREVQK